MRLLALILFAAFLPLAQAAPLQASLIPQQPLIEAARDEQRLNFDCCSRTMASRRSS